MAETVVLTSLANLPANTNPDEVFATRIHRILEKRQEKLRLNLMALRGGRPYIDERLTRFPAESAVDWEGAGGQVSKTRFAGVSSIGMEGRKTRAYNVNHAARVAEKIRQYVFAVPPERGDVPEDMARDITRQGDSLNAFMGDVLKLLVACRWCWIGIDSPSGIGEISQAEARARKVRPYWVLYDPSQVVDWRIDSAGRLEWLITEGLKWDNPDPFVPATETTVRRLWRPGVMEEWELEMDEQSGEFSRVIGRTTVEIEFSDVPFVPVGEISENPHWYDDVEDIQRAIMDLESCLDTLYHKVVFAQPVLPRSIAEDIAGETGGHDLSKAVSGILGYAYAILEGPTDKGIARYLSPDASSIGKMQEELERKRAIMFDTVGLHLGFTTKFSRSKESEAFDQLDPQAVLRNYSQQITEAEARAWQLTKQWDGAVPEITPAYTDRFNTGNIYDDFKALTLANQIDAPESVRRLVLQGVLDAVLEVTRQRLSPEQIEQLKRDIEEFEFDVPIALTSQDMTEAVGEGVRRQATDDGEGLRPSGAE